MPYFDRWDICAAYSLYACDYNDHGYTQTVHCRLNRIRYRPARSEEFIRGLSQNARDIYGGLVRRHEADVVAFERLLRRAKGRVPELNWMNGREVRAAFGAAEACYRPAA